MMEDLKPYTYCYKKITEPNKLKATFVVKVPAYKVILLRAGYPSIGDRKTTIIYDVETDNEQSSSRKEYKVHEMAWDGNAHEIEILIGSGGGTGGGTSTVNTADMEEY